MRKPYHEPAFAETPPPTAPDADERPAGSTAALLDVPSSPSVEPEAVPFEAATHAEVPTGYQGWTNYETWTTRLWIDNCERSYRYWRQVTRDVIEASPRCEEVVKGYWTLAEARRILLANRLSTDLWERSPRLGATMYADLLSAAFDEIDWMEIADSLLEDHAEAMLPEGGKRP